MNKSGYPQPMKISVLGTRGIPRIQGGVETHCEYIYPELVGLGCAVTVYRRLPYVQGDGLTEFNGVSLLDLSCPRTKSLEAIIHTFRGVMHAWRMKSSMLHIHAVGPALLTPLARALGMRVVITHHGPDYKREKWGMLAKAALRIGEWLGCRFANEVIAISKSIAEHITKKTGRRNVKIIPNGVEIFARAETFDVGTRYGLEKGKYILAVGRFVPEKAFVELIKAFGVFQDRRQKDTDSRENIKLVIAGDADHESATSRAIKELSAKNNDIILPGFVRGKFLRELFSHAGLFVIPSFYEGLPIALLEALSYGLPCLASDIPAHQEIALTPDRLFEAGDIQALGRKMQELIKKPFTEEESSKQINLVAQNYNWKKIAEHTLEVYKNI